MEQFLQERPELNNHVHGLKEDIAGLIKVLSEKLTTTNDIDAAIDDEVPHLIPHSVPRLNIDKKERALVPKGLYSGGLLIISNSSYYDHSQKSSETLFLTVGTIFTSKIRYFSLYQ